MFSLLDHVWTSRWYLSGTFAFLLLIIRKLTRNYYILHWWLIFHDRMIQPYCLILKVFRWIILLFYINLKVLGLSKAEIFHLSTLSREYIVLLPKLLCHRYLESFLARTRILRSMHNSSNHVSLDYSLARGLIRIFLLFFCALPHQLASQVFDICSSLIRSLPLKCWGLLAHSQKGVFTLVPVYLQGVLTRSF